MNYSMSVHSIVMEASSKEDKAYIAKMDKNDAIQVNAALVQNLYGSVMKMKDIDFGDIPDSEGDIEKVKYYESTIESLNILDKLYQNNNIDEPDVNDIRLAISNIKMFKPQFVNGFRTKNDTVMVIYNCMVMCVIDATSSTIGSYMNYLVSSEQVYVVRHNHTKQRGTVALDTIRKFNSACANGTMAECLSYAMKEQKSALMGTDDVIITGTVIMALLAIIPFIRECIFFYYHSRVKISDYLEMQADFLEMNKLAVETSARNPKEKKEIIKKQDALIKKMRKKADKLAINNVDTNDVAKKQIKEENSIWSLNNIEKKLTQDKLNGNGLNIL